MYTKDKSDSIFELLPIVVKFADGHNFSTLRRRVAFKTCNYWLLITPFIFSYLPWL